LGSDVETHRFEGDNVKGFRLLLGLHRRVAVAGLAIGLVAAAFWTSSRYPSLDEKAGMGGAIGIEPLGFDTLITVESGASFIYRTFATAANWLDTNLQGMIFGLVFAACFLSLLQVMTRRGFKGVFPNTALGAIIGTPLGVCVNCVAPIAQGMYRGGARLETAMATMVSSPTMNIIVLTMAFSLLPFYFAAIKLVLSLVVIMGLVPATARLVRSPQSQLGPQSSDPRPPVGINDLGDATGNADVGTTDTWPKAFRWFAGAFLRNLWFIAVRAVPLMLLAGLLGAMAITLLPWERLLALLPAFGSSESFVALAGLALLGLFLPVPIAFDVIIVVILLGQGLPAPYAMVLLFTLGIFSVYSFGIVWTTISRRVAVLFATALLVIGMVSGVVAHFLQLEIDERNHRLLQRGLALTDLTDAERDALAKLDRGPGKSVADIAAHLKPAAVSFSPVQVGSAPGIVVEYAGFRPNDPGFSESPFDRISGETLGIAGSRPFDLLQKIEPYAWGRSVATGDIHNDGWADILISDSGTKQGLELYANLAGKSFVRQEIDYPGLEELEIINAALVDIDNDGWLDILFSARRDGLRIIKNSRGDFGASSADPLPGTEGLTVSAIAYGDVDRDGDLDLALGSWSLGFVRRGDENRFYTRMETSRNLLLRQSEDGFVVESLAHLYGETLSGLLSDFSGDGHLDLFFGNDYREASDEFYLGDGSGNLAPIGASDEVIPHTTTSTMSVAVGDLNNDLTPEILVSQFAWGTGTTHARAALSWREHCDSLAGDEARSKCNEERLDFRTLGKGHPIEGDVEDCWKLNHESQRSTCLSLHVLAAVQSGADGDQCALIRDELIALKEICQEVVTDQAADVSAALTPIEQIRRSNVLLVRSSDLRFEDRANGAGLDVAGWAWNAKFADIDNDGDKDVYFANGHLPTRRRESNRFFMNQGNLTFVDRTDLFGLTETRATTTYSYVDFDRDGDIDIVALPVRGEFSVFVNRSVSENAIDISLVDEIGNGMGVGSKVVVRASNGAPAQQIVEIQGGGGFRSYDPFVAHFGLGDAKMADEIEVLWSTGETTVLTGPFEADGHYRITRHLPTESAIRDDGDAKTTR